MSKFKHCQYYNNKECSILNEPVNEDIFKCEYIRRIGREIIFDDNVKLKILEDDTVKTIKLTNIDTTNLINDGIILSTENKDYLLTIAELKTNYNIKTHEQTEPLNVTLLTNYNNYKLINHYILNEVEKNKPECIHFQENGNMHRCYSYDWCTLHYENIVQEPEYMHCEECRENKQYIICKECEDYQTNTEKINKQLNYLLWTNGKTQNTINRTILLNELNLELNNRSLNRLVIEEQIEKTTVVELPNDTKMMEARIRQEKERLKQEQRIKQLQTSRDKYKTMYSKLKDILYIINFIEDKLEQYPNTSLHLSGLYDNDITIHIQLNYNVDINNNQLYKELETYCKHAQMTDTLHSIKIEMKYEYGE